MYVCICVLPTVLSHCLQCSSIGPSDMHLLIPMLSQMLPPPGSLPCPPHPFYSLRQFAALYSKSPKHPIHISIKALTHFDILSACRYLLQMSVQWMNVHKCPQREAYIYTHTQTYIHIYMDAHTDIGIHTGTHRSRHRCINRQPPRHTQMCILAPTNTQAHMHMANSQVHAGTCPCVHAHTHPLGSHSLHTVSGRFLSLSSLRSKHWLIMGLSELHMVCEGRAGGQGGSTGKGRGDF